MVAPTSDPELASIDTALGRIALAREGDPSAPAIAAEIASAVLAAMEAGTGPPAAVSSGS